MTVQRIGFVFLVLIGFLRPTNAVASTFSGQVTDGTSGIANVDLDVFPAGTTTPLVTPGDDTNPTGFFSFDVPDGLYDVVFNPPLASRYIGTTRFNVTISGPTNLGTVVLESGFFLSGTLTTQGGSPVSSVPLRVINSNSGERFIPAGDTSDVNGAFSMAIPAGTWDLQVRPAESTRLVAQEIQGLTLGPDRSLGTLVLEAGFLLGFTVRDPIGSPVVGADIDIDRGSPPGRVFTPGDDTDSAGFVSVIAPGGALEVTVGADPSTRLVARRFPTTLTADTTLPDVILELGYFLSGTLTGPSGPVVQADLDVSDTFTGASIPTERDDTDAMGRFQLVVPAGSFNLELEPLVPSRLAGTRLLKIDVAADVNVGNISAAAGFLVSGTVANPNGRPRVGVDMDLYDASDGEIPAISDQTAADGTYAIVVPPGATDVVADATLESTLAHASQFDVSVTGDTTVNLTMPRATIAARVSLQEVGLLRGQSIHGAVELQNHAAQPLSGLVRVEATVRTSRLIRRTLVAPTRVDLAASSGVVPFGSFERRVPPNLNARLLRRPVSITVIVTDLSGQTELDRDIQQFFVY